jgi:N-acetylmuramoyl-L-alanine amidase
MTPQFTPTRADGTPAPAPDFRGNWNQAAMSKYKHPFSASESYGAHDFTGTDTGVTTIDDEGYTAIRVNLPPIAFNKARITLQIDGMPNPMDLIDLEVPAVVVMDPGHGGEDTGNTLTSVTPPLIERDLNLAYANEIKTSLQSKLKEQGHACRIVIGKQTKQDGKKFENGLRAAQAKKNGADVNLAIHFNGGEPGDTTSCGTQVYIVAQDNENINYGQDRDLANRMYEAGKAVFGAGNRSPDQGVIDRHAGADGCVFLRDSLLGNIPGAGRESTYIRAVLMEIEYLTTAGSERLTGANASVTRKNYADQAAQAVINDMLIQPQTNNSNN